MKTLPATRYCAGIRGKYILFFESNPQEMLHTVGPSTIRYEVVVKEHTLDRRSFTADELHAFADDLHEVARTLAMFDAGQRQ